MLLCSKAAGRKSLLPKPRPSPAAKKSALPAQFLPAAGQVQSVFRRVHEDAFVACRIGANLAATKVYCDGGKRSIAALGGEFQSCNGAGCQKDSSLASSGNWGL